MSRTTLTAQRNHLGYNLNEMAKKLDVAPTSIYRWEVGLRKPRIRSLRAIADAYEMTVADLVDALTEGGNHV